MDLTTTLLGNALMAAGLTERIIADNLANLDTPGYQERTVSFQTLLQRATTAEAAKAVRPEVEISPLVYRQDGNGVDPDREMVLLAKSGLRYTLLAEELRQRYQDLLRAASGVA